MFNFKYIPRSINLSVGRSCFVRCSGCYNHFGKEKILTPTARLLAFLSYARSIGVNNCTMCGGDPLSREDILYLLKKTKDLLFHITLDTVGTPILGQTRVSFYGRQYIPEIKTSTLKDLVDVIGIPIDGANNSSFLKFRNNRENILDEQLEIIRRLDDSSMNICINTVAHKHNMHNVHEILNLISRFKNISLWQIFQFMPIGPAGYKNRTDFEINEDDFEDIKGRVTKATELIEFSGKIEYKSRTARKGIYLLIDTDGFAWTPDTSMNRTWDTNQDATNKRIILGNINNDEDFAKIFSKYSNLKSLLMGRKEFCNL